MRIKTLAVAAGMLIALAAPASAAATTLIGSGSVAAEPVLRPLFSKYQKVTHGKAHFLYTANGGNAGVADVQSGRSQFAGQARPPLPSDAGTTYIKLYLDGLCVDVHPSNSLSNLSIPQVADIYHAVTTNWSQVPGVEQERPRFTPSAVTRTEERSTSSSRACSTTSRRLPTSPR